MVEFNARLGNQPAEADRGGDDGSQASVDILAAAKLPAAASPGSQEKINILAARFSLKIPLWNREDEGMSALDKLDLDDEPEADDGDDDLEWEDQEAIGNISVGSETPDGEAIEVAPRAPAGCDREATIQVEKPKRSYFGSRRRRTHGGDSSSSSGVTAEPQGPTQVVQDDFQERVSVYRSLVEGVNSGMIHITAQYEFEQGNRDVVTYVNQINEAPPADSLTYSPVHK